jgi:adenine-specific DNA methylase
LFRGLALAEFGNKPLREIFFKANDFPGKRVCDPFMGGGTPLLEANRIGCDVLGFDINPMAAWIVREELEHLDLGAYRSTADTMLATLTEEIGGLYRTDCTHYGDKNVAVKYTLWVKVLDCAQCGEQVDLFPGYLLADDTRHPVNAGAAGKCWSLKVRRNEDVARVMPAGTSIASQTVRRLCATGPSRWSITTRSARSSMQAVFSRSRTPRT